MDRLFIIGFDENGNYDQRDIDVLNDYLCHGEREITAYQTMLNGELMIIVTD